MNAKLIIEKLKLIFNVTSNLDLSKELDVPLATISYWLQKNTFDISRVYDRLEERSINFQWLLTDKSDSKLYTKHVNDWLNSKKIDKNSAKWIYEIFGFRPIIGKRLEVLDDIELLKISLELLLKKRSKEEGDFDFTEWLNENESKSNLKRFNNISFLNQAFLTGKSLFDIFNKSKNQLEICENCESKNVRIRELESQNKLLIKLVMSKMKDNDNINE